MPICTVAYEDSSETPSTEEEGAAATEMPRPERDRLEKEAYKHTPAKLKLIHDGHPSVLVRNKDGATVLEHLYRMCDENLVAYAKSVGASEDPSSAKEDNTLRLKPITICKVASHKYLVFIDGNPVVDVSPKNAKKQEFSCKGMAHYVEGSPLVVFKTKDDAERFLSVGLDRSPSSAREDSTSTSTRTATSTKTATDAYTADNFTATVTGGAGTGDTVVHIYSPSDESKAAETAGYAIVTRDPAKFAEWRARATAIGPLKNAQCIHDLLASTCNSEDQEVFLVVPLDLRGDLRCEPIEIARGQRDRVSVNSEDVLRAVVGSGCQGFVVVHNHPSGKCHPSPADKKLTATIRKATKETFPHIAFVDHVIIASEGFYSFTDDKTTRTPRTRAKETKRRK
jgi:proteasome lid subunit RPN8/RPN11